MTAIVTIRDVKNTETGLDVTIPQQEDTHGIVGVSTVYHVVAVSNLVCFKSAKQKHADVVQFMVPRVFKDFVTLHTQLSERYSSTLLPPLPGTTLIVSEKVARQRRNVLESFLKFLACTPKMATCPLFLRFLGVRADRALAFSKQENILTVRENREGERTAKPDNTLTVQENNGGEGTAIQDVQVRRDEEYVENEPAKVSLFGDDDDVDDGLDMFAAEPTRDRTLSHDMFGVMDSSAVETSKDVRIFEEQNYEDSLPDDDPLYLPGTLETKLIKVQVTSTEDNSDLLKIEDDLDKFLHIDVSTKASSSSGRPISNKPAVPTKPNMQGPRPKPVLCSKPVIAQHMDHRTNPTLTGDHTAVPDNKGDNDAIPARKGDNAAIPAHKGDNLAIMPHKGDNHAKGEHSDGVNVSELANDDIMKYIMDNRDSETIDLFS